MRDFTPAPAPPYALPSGNRERQAERANSGLHAQHAAGGQTRLRQAEPSRPRTRSLFNFLLKSIGPLPVRTIEK